jgi:GR25 family glycosyltransferase involved in LPS biosynthesis
MKYYLIHGVDKMRESRMINEFLNANIPLDDVCWIRCHNKDTLTYDFVKQLLIQTESNTCGIPVAAGCPTLRPGQISCTFKHYLALEDMVKNNYPYAVIMEDNIFFNGNVPERINIYIQQLNNFYPDWDILFDTNWKTYAEGPIINGLFVYPKSNEINQFGHGGSRCAQFYLLTLNCSKKLYKNYIPFNNSPDWWMNDLFRKLNIKSFWAEPSIADVFPHVSTAN